ncbi:hypothetical protein BBJ28_00011995 [Nothophytophthora sp. Chile5]|nr:hypothetical protein BBJ28_00011995 [Nothophytophthora sp. Chile5]
MGPPLHTFALSRRRYEGHPKSDQATPRGDVEHSEVAKELSNLRERVQILSAETDTAQGDVRDNEENLESLSKTVFDLRGQLESLKQSHSALKEQNRRRREGLPEVEPPKKKHQSSQYEPPRS